jgi:hypothetical protein
MNHRPHNPSRWTQGQLSCACQKNTIIFKGARLLQMLAIDLIDLMEGDGRQKRKFIKQEQVIRVILYNKHTHFPSWNSITARLDYVKTKVFNLLNFFCLVINWKHWYSIEISQLDVLQVIYISVIAFNLSNKILSSNSYKLLCLDKL